MSCVRVLAAVGLLGLSFTTSLASLAAQALEVRGSIPELPAPASSLEDMWRKAEVVVVGTVTDIGSPLVSRGRTVYRLCAIGVEELLKAPPSVSVGPVITVFQPGGTVRVDTVEYRTSFIAEPFVVGDRMVLFLESSMEDGRQVFTVRVAGGGALRSRYHSEAITVRGPLVALPELRGRSTLRMADIVAQLRSYR